MTTKKDLRIVVVAGYRETADEGFVSSKVIGFDQPSMTLTTWGEEVILVGQNGGYSRDRDRIWTAWCARMNPRTISDVSLRYLPKKRKTAA